MSVARHRKHFSRATKNLRRARRIYAVLVRRVVMSDPTGIAMIRARRYAKKVGLYAAATPESSVGFSLLRRFWLMETGGARRGWHDWCRKHGASAYRGTLDLPKEKAA